MKGNSPEAELRVGNARAEVPIDVGCITKDELAGWLKLVESEIPKANISGIPTLPEPADPPSFSRTRLAMVATFAVAVTFAWLALLVWLAFKGVSQF